MTDQTCVRCARPAPHGYLCTRCGDELHGWLAEAPELARQLDIEITRRARHAKGPTATTTGREQPLPVNLWAAEVKRAVLDALRAMQRAIAHDRPPGNTIAGCCAWLAHHERRITQLPAAAGLTGALDVALKRARRTIDNPPEQRFIGVHPCGERLHAWRNLPDERGYREERWIQCPNPACGGRVGVEEAISGLEDRCRDQLLTLREIATLAEVKLGTVQRWADRRRILPRGVTDGARTFRFGDALVLREQMLDRKAG